MGIAGSFCDADFWQEYLGIRAEWVDMVEVTRRVELGIYDHEEYERALKWVKENCPEGFDKNPENIRHTPEQKEKEWEFVVKMTLICRDIMLGNDKLNDVRPVGAEAEHSGPKDGWHEEALGRNAILGGFQGQRQWTDFMPNGDFTEAMLNTTFDWNGKKEPLTFATENDGLNGLSMLLGKLVTGRASLFADVRTYWSPDAVERVCGMRPEGVAKDGFIHLINSGAAALDATGVCKDKDGNAVMKEWWNVTDEDIDAMLKATDWCPADLGYFRGGGYSSHFKTQAVMPMTMIRINIIKGLGPVLQIAEATPPPCPMRYTTSSTCAPTDLADHMVCSETHRQGRVQGCLLRHGELGRKPRRYQLRSHRQRPHHAREHAQNPRCDAQRRRRGHLPSARMVCVRHKGPRECRLQSLRRLRPAV